MGQLFCSLPEHRIILSVSGLVQRLVQKKAQKKVRKIVTHSGSDAEGVANAQ